MPSTPAPPLSLLSSPSPRPPRADDDGAAGGGSGLLGKKKLFHIDNLPPPSPPPGGGQDGGGCDVSSLGSVSRTSLPSLGSERSRISGSRKRMRKGTGDKKRSSGSSVGSLNRHKLRDKQYLAEESALKFERGLLYVRRGRYDKAREKFRTTLKARVLLHGDARHSSVAPVHEMLGHVERKLDDRDRAAVHYRAALDIVELDLKKRSEGEGADTNRRIAERIGRSLDSCTLDAVEEVGEEEEDSRASSGRGGESRRSGGSESTKSLRKQRVAAAAEGRSPGGVSPGSGDGADADIGKISSPVEVVLLEDTPPQTGMSTAFLDDIDESGEEREHEPKQKQKQIPIEETAQSSTSSRQERGTPKAAISEGNAPIRMAVARKLLKRGSFLASKGMHWEASDSYRESLEVWAEVAPLPPAAAEALAEEGEEEAEGGDGGPALMSNHFLACKTALLAAASLSALGEEVLEGGGAKEGEATPVHRSVLKEEALEHHLLALALATDAKRLVLGGLIAAGSESTTVVGGSVEHLDGEEGGDSFSEELFVEECSLVQSRQCVCIAHALFRAEPRNGVAQRPWAGRRWRSSSRKYSEWISAAVDAMGEEEDFAEARKAAYEALALSSAVANSVSGTENRGGAAAVALYERGIPLLQNFARVEVSAALDFEFDTDGELRDRFHEALALLEDGRESDAMLRLDRVIESLREFPQAPMHVEEYMIAIDATIMIRMKQRDTRGAVKGLKIQLELMSTWNHEDGFAEADINYRLGCLHDVLGYYRNCERYLEKAIDIHDEMGRPDENRLLGILRSLATTYDVMSKNEEAIETYNDMLEMEDDHTEQAKIYNAISDIHIRTSKLDDAAECLKSSIALQAFASDDKAGSELMARTAISFGNVLAVQKSFAEAIVLYDRALDCNKIEGPLHPQNLRARYNKGVISFQMGDVACASECFSEIIEEVDDDVKVTKEIAYVLNGIGNVHFVREGYEKAVNCYTECLRAEGHSELCNSLRAGTLCNIAVVKYKMRSYEEAVTVLESALEETTCEGVSSNEAVVMSKLGCVHYRLRNYGSAYSFLSKAALIREQIYGPNDADFIRCESYAEACRLKLISEGKDDIPKKKAGVVARKPKFDPNLVVKPDQPPPTEARDAVEQVNKKLLIAFGFKDSDSIEFQEATKTIKPDSYGNKITLLSDAALKYVLTQTELSRNEHERKFRRMLLEKLDNIFVNVKKSLSSM